MRKWSIIAGGRSPAMVYRWKNFSLAVGHPAILSSPSVKQSESSTTTSILVVLQNAQVYATVGNINKIEAWRLSLHIQARP